MFGTARDYVNSTAHQQSAPLIDSIKFRKPKTTIGPLSLRKKKSIHKNLNRKSIIQRQQL